MFFLTKKIDRLTLNIIKDKEIRIHEIEGIYKIQKRLVSFATKVLNAEIKDCTKIAAVIAKIIVLK